MVKVKRGANPRILAARALQNVRLARLAIARLEGRLKMVEDNSLASQVLSNTAKIKELLDYIALKLEIFVATGIALDKTLGEAARASGILRDLATSLPPQAASLILEIDESLRGLLQASGIPVPSEEDPSTRELNSDAKSILEEAESIAKMRRRLGA
ncbi:MAG: hypothetical protein LRS46_01375 [Desulfurococcales archaeon]|nr:hypothetical protein [Desulfurococcales archaeon]